MLVGQMLLSFPVFLPDLLGWLHRTPLLRAPQGLGVPLGRWVGSAAVKAAISSRGPSLDAHAGVSWLQQGYAASAMGFYCALLCLIVGNALMKSTLVVLCGETMDPSDPRREAAFAYYLGISVGAMLSESLVGVVAQSFGWHFGFIVAAGGMAIALGCYLAFSKRWLGAIGSRPDLSRRGPSSVGGATEASAQAPGEALRRVALLVMLALLLSAFSIGWFQLFGVQETTVPNTPPPNAIDDRIAAALSAANGPVPIAELRALCRVRKATLCARLAALTASGHLVRDDLGYRLAFTR
jgi:dipeptide/tripeptide permease